jgi:S-adenosylmethionine:tRNA ribosyltransferase-isomerase
MDVAEFNFDLPADLIAQAPPAVRGTSKLLILDRASGQIEHADVSRLPDFLSSGDLLVVNDSKVFPARLLGRRTPSAGAVEFLLLSRLEDDRWDALVHPGQKLKPGARVTFGEAPDLLYGEVLDRHFHGRRTIRLWTEHDRSVDDVIDAIGHVPLPPYIKRDDNPQDRERYQTVYAAHRGSIAAPTAGLHFTPEILSALARKGVERASVTLHVGYGTFQPVRVSRVEEHAVGAERFSIGEDGARSLNRAKQEGRRVIAVGTTTTRALESAIRAGGGVVTPQSGWTDLFIFPGFEFLMVSGLMTNFHLPASSLLMLVSAFAGREKVLAAYRDAVARGYRFYSYGDAMLVL